MSLTSGIYYIIELKAFDNSTSGEAIFSAVSEKDDPNLLHFVNKESILPVKFSLINEQINNTVTIQLLPLKLLKGRYITTFTGEKEVKLGVEPTPIANFHLYCYCNDVLTNDAALSLKGYKNSAYRDIYISVRLSDYIGEGSGAIISFPTDGYERYNLTVVLGDVCDPGICDSFVKIFNGEQNKVDTSKPKLSDYTADNPLIVSIRCHETISAVQVYARDVSGNIIRERKSGRPIKSIELSYDPALLALLPGADLEAVVVTERATNKGVTWESSDESYVEIVKSNSTSALIEVHDGGSQSSPKIVSITATSKDDPKKSGSFEVKCVRI
ncbi:MAG: hypothetical protein V6Z82_00675 [Flavobacteriales bacterium]